MSDRLQPGEIRPLPAGDPQMKKIRTMRDDFLQIAQAQGASIDEYGSALVASLAAVIYGSAKGDINARNVRVNMVIDGFNQHFAQYDKLGGMAEAIRRELQGRANG